jgi:carboxyl-terminal processing protease
LRRGDTILSADGQPFHPLRSFRGRSRCVLTVRRGGDTFFVPIAPVYESPHRSLLEAMRNSTRIADVGRYRVGYIHLWSLLSPLIQEEFVRRVRDSLATADGIILDLRGGFGGAWAGYLDPFFADRHEYAVVNATNRSGPVQIPPPDSLKPHAFYSGPMVVLIDEGTRSGKEAIAFQFKKSHRARILGTTTAGAFLGAQFYASPEDGYILAVALTSIRLDGEKLEGRGVTPDVCVEHPLETPAGGDPQLDRAFEEIKPLLGRR